MLNNIIVMGRLVKAPELKATKSGINVLSFSVANERDFAKGEEKKTDFIDCVAWRSTAEFISKYFKRGSMIVVQGRLQPRKWEDRDGNKRTSWEIQVNNAYFGESKKETRSSDSAPELTDADAPQIVDLGDFDPDNELPFEL